MTEYKDVAYLVTRNHFNWLLDLADEIIDTDAKGELRREDGVLDSALLVAALRNSGSERINDMHWLSQESQSEVLAAVAGACIAAEAEGVQFLAPKRSARDILNDVANAEKTGWDKQSCIDLLGNFIESKGLLGEFEQYIQEVARAEAEEEYQIELAAAQKEGDE